MNEEIKEILRLGIEQDASDVHLTEGMPPVFRVNGTLIPADYKNLTREDTKRLIYSILSPEQKSRFEKEWELDFSLYYPELARFRTNVHIQRGNVEAAFRIISAKIRGLEELGLPTVVEKLALKPSGLVLITGPAGVGKTTTLAAMVDLINTERKSIIITIEDPIEYLHTHKKGIVKQREVGSDTRSFTVALKHVLRQDPNVILVGEMRDLETIATTITAAETGHLILSTLHTPDATQTIDRLVDVFPPYQQAQIRTQLASSIQGIVCQQLLPRVDGRGRVVAVEILVVTDAIRSLIREQKFEQIPTAIQTGGQLGMRLMDRSLKELYQKGIISYEVALSKVKDVHEFKEYGD